MQEFKSKYQMKMEKLTKEGKVKVLSPRECRKVSEEFTAGFSEFNVAQNKRDLAALKDLSNIYLNK